MSNWHLLILLCQPAQTDASRFRTTDTLKTSLIPPWLQTYCFNSRWDLLVSDLCHQLDFSSSRDPASDQQTFFPLHTTIRTRTILFSQGTHAYHTHTYIHNLVTYTYTIHHIHIRRTHSRTTDANSISSQEFITSFESAFFITHLQIP